MGQSEPRDSLSLRTTDKRTWQILLIVWVEKVERGCKSVCTEKECQAHIKANNLCWVAKIADLQLLGIYFLSLNVPVLFLAFLNGTNV